MPNFSKNCRFVTGARFKGSSFWRPTSMSAALVAAGIIDRSHLVSERTSTAVLRHKRDFYDNRPSITVAF